jgi:hypothetical protein
MKKYYKESRRSGISYNNNNKKREREREEGQLDWSHLEYELPSIARY